MHRLDADIATIETKNIVLNKWLAIRTPSLKSCHQDPQNYADNSLCRTIFIVTIHFFAEASPIIIIIIVITIIITIIISYENLLDWPLLMSSFVVFSSIALSTSTKSLLLPA